MRNAPRATAAALLLAAACGGSQAPNGFTYPGLESHERWFPLMGTAHEPATSPPAADFCSQCHATSSFRAAVNCRACHLAMTDPARNPDAIHAGMADYDAARATGRTDFCRDCHPQGQAGITDAAHHTFFPVGAGTKHNRSCVACHGSADKKDLAALRCAACHQDPALFPGFGTKHALVKDYPAASPTSLWCLRCHDGGQVDRVAAHGTRSGPPGAGSAGPWDGDHGRSGAPVTCTGTCHDWRPPAFGGPGPGIAGRPWAQEWKLPAAGQPASQTCIQCHAFGGGD